MLARILLLVGFAALAAGCAGPSFEGRPSLNYVGQAELPEPTREDFAIPLRPYVIGPSDKIDVEVFGVEELSRSVTVDSAGQVALPLIGTMKVAGLTSTELADVITNKLSDGYVRDPQVSVNVAEAASQVFTVDGEVKNPGLYPIVGQMSLMRAVARASGTTEFARENFVVVFRRAGGQEYAALYDLRAIRTGLYPDPEIYSNDVIYVGESRARRVFKDVLSASGVITAPIIALLR